MEAVQSWWEVPAVAHFCYVFRSAFNLFYFEVAELESALLNIQDPDLSLSLDQLIIRMLQGFYDEESVSDYNWETKLHELFDDNFEKDENPFVSESHFFNLTPRSKIEVLFKLCQLRLDVEGAIEEIKNIPSEDMQAKCLGTDKENNTYWYFDDERLYKEDSNLNKIEAQPNEIDKNTSIKNRQNGKERRRKNIDAVKDLSWSIVCSNLNDWEKLLAKFSKRKNSQEKELSESIKNLLPVIQKRVAEKDRLLRKRLMELAPKRSSSRISKVQAQKKMEEMKAAEKEREAKLQAERERARKEALLLKERKEARQRRAEERMKAIEERAERAKLRELTKEESQGSSEDNESDSINNKSDSNNNKSDSNNNESKGNDNDRYGRGLRNISKNGRTGNLARKYLQESDDSESEDDWQKNNKQKAKKRIEKVAHNKSSNINPKSYLRTYLKLKQQSRIHLNTSSNFQSYSEKIQSRESVRKVNDKSGSKNSTYQISYGIIDKIGNVSYNENSCNSDISSNNIFNESRNSYNCIKTGDSSKTSSNGHSNSQQEVINKNLLPRVTIYKSNVLQKSPDLSKWTAAFGCKGQKFKILHTSNDSMTSKKLKLDELRTFQAVSPTVKSLLKENHINKSNFQTPFITYGKVTPKPIVKVENRKPSNQELSS